MLTWGRPRIEGESVEAAFRASFRRYNQRGLVYQKELFQDSYVISGALGADTGYYEKQVLLKGAWVGLLFKYVSPNGRTVSPVIAAVSTSFPTCGKQTEPPKPLAVDEVDKIPAGATGTDLARRYCNCQAKANAYAKQLLDQIRSDSAVLTYANSRAALDRHFEWVELVGERYGQCKRIRQKADMSFSDEVKREFKASPDFRRTLAMLADSASVSQEWTNTSEVWCARLAQTKANALRNRPR